MSECDMMCGMGESWEQLTSRLESQGRIIALDNSNGMLRNAKERATRFDIVIIQIPKENALINSLLDGTVDSVISGFGFKTFCLDQMKIFSRHIYRVLKQNGTLSIIGI